MQFEYDQYYRNHFLIPILLTAFMLFLLIRLLVETVRRIVKWRRERKINTTDLTKSVLGLIVFTFLLSKTTDSLRRGGWYLWKEKENNAIATVGVVESIAEDELTPKYQYGDTRCYGAVVIVDGETYYMMTSDGIAVGSTVRMTYLPQSRYVLSVECLDGAEAASAP